MLFEILIKNTILRENVRLVLNAENYTDAEAKAYSYIEQEKQQWKASLAKISIKELSKYKVIQSLGDGSLKNDVWYKATVVNGISERGKELTERILFDAKNSYDALEKAETYAVEKGNYEAARCIQLKETDISEVVLDEEK